MLFQNFENTRVSPYPLKCICFYYSLSALVIFAGLKELVDLLIPEVYITQMFDFVFVISNNRSDITKMLDFTFVISNNRSVYYPNA